MTFRPLASLALVAAVAAGAVVTQTVATQTAEAQPDKAAYASDTVHSYVFFRIRHLGASWNYGRFNDFTTTIEADPATGAVASVAFTVKAESVDTGNAARDKHIRNPDFLNSKQFPEITFRSTSAKAIDAETTEVAGELTLHGETKPLTVQVKKVGEGKGMKGESLVGWETTFTVKRSEFGMTNMVGPLGDEITMTVAVEGSKQ